MKEITLMACLIALCSQANAADLHIKAGTPYVINQDQAQLQLDKLVIDDKATIQLAPGLARWQVSAKAADMATALL